MRWSNRALAVAGAVLLLPVTATASPTQAAGPTHAAPAVTGFALSNLSQGRLDASVAGLTTLAVDGVGLSADGARVARPTAQMDRQLARAHAHGLTAQFLVSNYSSKLGDFDPDRVHALLATAQHRSSVAAALARSAVAGGWDGVTIDLELVPARDARRLTAFARTLRADLDGRSLAIDISATGSVAGYHRLGYDLAGLAGAVDVVQLMAYDQHGPTWSGPGPVGALPWQRRSLAALTSVVPRDRVDLGVAGYGYTWPRHGTGRTVGDAGARRLVARDGAQPVWHTGAGEWSARLDDGTAMWWSDARSYRLRSDLARQQGLHGLAVWRLGSSDALPSR